MGAHNRRPNCIRKAGVNGAPTDWRCLRMFQSVPRVLRNSGSKTVLFLGRCDLIAPLNADVRCPQAEPPTEHGSPLASQTWLTRADNSLATLLRSGFKQSHDTDNDQDNSGNCASKQNNSGWASNVRIDDEDEARGEQNDQSEYEWTAPTGWSSDLRRHLIALLGNLARTS